MAAYLNPDIVIDWGDSKRINFTPAPTSGTIDLTGQSLAVYFAADLHQRDQAGNIINALVVLVPTVTNPSAGLCFVQLTGAMTKLFPEGGTVYYMLRRLDVGVEADLGGGKIQVQSTASRVAP